MTTLVSGASGATGKHLVLQLLQMGQNVKIIVRSTAKIPEDWKNNEKVTIITANITEISTAEMANYLKDCSAVASCLGHNLTLKGIFGKPRKLVTNAVILLCNAIRKNTEQKPVKLVLMNTAGNRDFNEPVSFWQKFITGLIRLLIPPYSDNEKAAEFFRSDIKPDHARVEWVVVRPDSLIDLDKVTEYEIHASPTRSALFNPGKTSRINTANFMARLLTENDLWEKWKGRMPVIYNKEDLKK